MNRAVSAVIKKDFFSITSNRRLFSTILIVPLVLTIVLPSVFVIAVHFVPDDPDVLKLLELLPQEVGTVSVELAVIGLIFNYILPVFFLMIPIMTASVMAASSFVGEKEKRTLETLLYCPLSVKQIFQAKVLASFLFSMLVSLISFAAMLTVLELEVFFLTANLVARDKLAYNTGASLAGHSTDRSDFDREGLGKGAEYGGIPAGRSVFDHSGAPSHCGAVYRSPAVKCMDPAGAKRSVRISRLDSFTESNGKVYL